MQTSYFLTEENLLGSIADAMLQLKRIRDGRNTSSDKDFFVKLIEFLAKATRENYQELLYDKYFVVSEQFLGSLHFEMRENNLENIVDFALFKNLLSEVAENPTTELIDDTMQKLRDIGKVVLRLKNQNEI